MTKIKTDLWQDVQNQQQSNYESALLKLKSIEWPEIELIQNQHFDNKSNLQLTKKLRRNIYKNKEMYYFYTDGSLFKTASNKTKNPAMGAAWSKLTKMKPNSLNKVCIEPETGIFNEAGITSNSNGPLHGFGKEDGKNFHR
ncbi:13119_t:CDS:1 [Gigaspora rosea]|nr:13119_t:CDS:1 [Gigaspora rosea]